VGNPTQNRDSLVTINAGTRASHRFVDWTIPAGVTLTAGSATGTTISFRMPDNAVSVTANWQETGEAGITGDMPNQEVGLPYNNAFDVRGIPAPTMGHSITAGSLPTGLTFATTDGDVSGTPRSTAAFSGTPTAPGTFTIRVTASNVDSTGTAYPATAERTITIWERPAIDNLDIYTSSATSGHILTDIPFTHTFALTPGFPVVTQVTMTGALPAGLTYNPTTRVLSGTPTQSGVFTVTLSAVNQFARATENVTITVWAAPEITNNTAAPDGREGTPYNFTLQATGFPTPIEWTADSGLPAWLTLNPATGQLTGTPPHGSSGTESFNVTATNLAGADTKPVNITFAPPLYTLTIANDPAGIRTTGQTPSGTHERGDIINPLLEGSAVRASDNAPYTFKEWIRSDTDASIAAASSFEMPDNNVTLTAKWVIKPWITQYTPPTGREGTPFTYTFRADASPAVHLWEILNRDGTPAKLPDGLTLDPATGVLSGTPTTAGGPYSFIIRATNSEGYDEKTFTLEIRPPIFEIVVRFSFYFGITYIRTEQERGTTYTLTHGSRNGHTFVGWTSDDVTIQYDGEKPSFVVPNNDVEVIAHWTRGESNIGGTDSGSSRDSGGSRPSLPIPPAPPAPTPAPPAAAVPNDAGPGAAYPQISYSASPAVVTAPAAPDAPAAEEQTAPGQTTSNRPVRDTSNLMELEEPPTPLVDGSAVTTAVWSLVNLLLCIFTALLMVLKIVPALKKRKTGNRRSMLVTFLPALAVVALFITTQDMRLTMQMFDVWTPWKAVIAAVQILVFCFGNKIFKEEEETEAQASEY
jgi:uncharacterized repeat protein (TIGR02543 family)